MVESVIKLNNPQNLDVHELIAFIYGLSRSDVEVLHAIMTSNGPITTEDIAKKLNVTKASVSKSLNNLIEKGLVMRNKTLAQEKRKGRPSYYYIVDRDYLTSKIIKDLEAFTATYKEAIKTHFMKA
ncbi:MAG: MarR family transcriptional regulator [Sulfolobaceae archaeon]|nr:MarR family transcriptional regulator [Sulfolobaceae archaeon]